MRIVLALAFCLMSGSLANAGSGRSLNFLTWEAYVSPDVIAAFTKETGIEVHQIFYDTGDKRDEILSSPESAIDAVIINESGARLFGAKGMLAERRNAPGQGTAMGDRFIERCGDHAQPYFWGTLGIAYRSDMVRDLAPTWKSLLEPAPALKGHIAMMDDYSDSLVPALVALGKSINSVDSATLKEVFALLKKQAPSVITYRYAISSVQDPAIGPNIHVALAYSGDEKTLSEMSGKPGLWKYVLPREGTLVWLDCISVVKGSANEAAAQLFLDFLARDDIAAMNSIGQRLPPVNPRIVPLLPEAMRNDIALMNPENVVAKSEFTEILPGDGVQVRKRIISTLANFHVAQ